MCGIAGLAGRFPLRPLEIESVRAAQAAMAHRGPDGGGEFLSPGASQLAMVMRRLSIIDLRGGWQPLYNEDKSLALIANGEIYNHIELQETLKGRGHRFSSGSDCETILHLYEDHGEAAIDHLRGMFAFALYDFKREKLWLARDRMGEKPLYLYECDGRIAFASELKSLLRMKLAESENGSVTPIPFELDPAGVNLYFHYAYVPEPRTILKGIRKLEAGHTLTVDLKSWRSETRCYWRMEDAPPLDADPATAIREKLEEIGALIIRSDVPVGVALSGGLDSSAIAALAAKNYKQEMHAFSVGYPGRPQFDERAAAADFAKRLKMSFHDVELNTEEMVQFFPRLCAARDDPIADISGFGHYAVMRLAREHNVPVLLQGQGGDELFWGYPWVRQAVDETRRKQIAFEKGWSALPNYFAKPQPDATGKLPRTGFKRWARNWGGLKPALKHYRQHRTSPAERMVFYDLAPGFQQAEQFMPHLFKPGYAEQISTDPASDPFAEFTHARPWPDLGLEMTRLICRTYLRLNGLTQGDRLSMACSVEMRLPLVDYRFVETVIGLRKRHHDYALPPKTWFKSALKGLVPEDVMQRPKRGFEPPVLEWTAKLFEQYGTQLESGYLVSNGIFSSESARSFKSRPWPLSYEALVLEVWAAEMKKSLSD